MPFGMMSGVGRGTGAIDGDGDRLIVEGKWIWGVNLGRHIVTSGDCDASLPKLLWA